MTTEALNQPDGQPRSRLTREESVLDLGALQAIREMGGEDGDFVLNNITAFCATM
jgi:hypothetical protein